MRENGQGGYKETTAKSSSSNSSELVPPLRAAFFVPSNYFNSVLGTTWCTSYRTVNSLVQVPITRHDTDFADAITGQFAKEPRKRDRSQSAETRHMTLSSAAGEEEEGKRIPREIF